MAIVPVRACSASSRVVIRKPLSTQNMSTATLLARIAPMCPARMM
ncbi:hypothetical protein Ga0074812_102216 [Parafrankia irregularis]|uniref:Uncharacterized protein n=1 Tax=Parafrankia irregularis TaxID=795642 RepID=A0A0S4QGH6_9ACTN|nr:hypothetical protein Ga0074812_102216 [Parafrankia irregularis]